MTGAEINPTATAFEIYLFFQQKTKQCGTYLQ